MNISQPSLESIQIRVNRPLVKLNETFPKKRDRSFKPTDQTSQLSKTAVPWRQVFSNYSDALIAGISLRESRKLLELTQHQLSQRTGISQRQISELENGKRSLTEEMAKKFATVLQVDYRVFL